jgi:hypothetical protein
MRRYERKIKRCSSRLHQQQGDTMSNTPQTQDHDERTEGWHLTERSYLAVLKDQQYCVFCGGTASWLWERVNKDGSRTQWIFVCKNHANRLEVDKNDPNNLLRTDSTYPIPGRGVTITKSEIDDYLGHCHIIPISRGWKSKSHWKFKNFNHLELMKQLQKVGAVKKSDHFSGWQTRKQFTHATYLGDGYWEVNQT